MIYLLRFSIRNEVEASDRTALNTYVDERLIPALEATEGVTRARVYSTYARELVLLLELEGASAIDYILADPRLDEATAPFLDWAERQGPGELLFDRVRIPVFNALTYN